MVLSTSKYGFLSGIIKAAKVFAWVVASGAVAAGAAYIANYHVDPNNLYLVGGVALVNAFFAGIGKWLGTVNPHEVAPQTELAVGENLA